MTTAARPTFEPAKGGSGRGERDLSALSKQYSSRDLPAHTRLKYREHGQTTSEELRGRDMRRELEDRERAAAGEKRTSGRSRDSGPTSSSSSSSSKKPRLEQMTPANLDADDPQDSDSDDDDSDDDEDRALMRELELIRRDRAEEEAAKQRERQQAQERIRMENIISGNPLLNFNAKSDMQVRKRWDDDVVFKNCASTEPKAEQKPFINDSLRSEFHKRFMEKYVK